MTKFTCAAMYFELGWWRVGDCEADFLELAGVFVIFVSDVNGNEKVTYALMLLNPPQDFLGVFLSSMLRYLSWFQGDSQVRKRNWPASCQVPALIAWS
ncbi:MAG: hypothetical protein Q3976_00040 [Corynebacterium sp.]|nr:hypothetical protein [Corynebacterium sp.]